MLVSIVWIYPGIDIVLQERAFRQILLVHNFVPIFILHAFFARFLDLDDTIYDSRIDVRAR
jgi:hypothetical protein